MLYLLNKLRLRLLPSEGRGGRLKLPFTDCTTVPYHRDLSTLNSNLAAVRVLYNLRTRVRYGPRGIRNVPTLYSLCSVTYHDAEFD